MMSMGEGNTWLWSWWWGALTSPVTLSCAGMMVALVIIGATALRAAVRLGAGGPACSRAGPAWSEGRYVAAEGGTATIEFALILPILLVVILLLLQTTLVMGGNLFVHYSAFAAARSAVVQIPARYEGEPANWYADARGARKREAIHRSAAMALLPVAGPRGPAADEAWLGAGVAEGLGAMHRRLGEAEPPWVGDIMPGRMSYALQQTDIEVLRMQEDGEAERLARGWVGPRDAIAVRIEHKLHLSIPYVNRIFADGRTEEGGLTMRLAARSMLTNFGLLDELPEAPALRRVPQ